MILTHLRAGVALWTQRDMIQNSAGEALQAFMRRDPIPRHWSSWREFIEGGGMDHWRWNNFTPAELACNCNGKWCEGEYFHDPDFLDRLQRVRDIMGVPLRINSAHRCAMWNASVGGAPRSRHKRIAADISLHGLDLAKLYQAARAVDFNGIGFAASFLHVDVRDRPAVWGYGPVGAQVWAPIGIMFDPASNGRRVTSIPKKEALG